MNRRILSAVAPLAFFLVLAAGLPALAQTKGGPIVTKVPFEFSVGDKTFPAGEYRVVHQKHQLPHLRIQSADGKLTSALTPVTRLASQHTGDAPNASLVFDLVQEKHILSEVWVSGEDGYLLRGTQEEHQHEVIDVK